MPEGPAGGVGTLREIIERDRLPRLSRRAGQRFRMTVVRAGRGCEHDTSVEDRKDPLYTLLDVGRPELEMAPVLFFPVPVQVDEKIQPAKHSVRWMVAKIDVHR